MRRARLDAMRASMPRARSAATAVAPRRGGAITCTRAGCASATARARVTASRSVDGEVLGDPLDGLLRGCVARARRQRAVREHDRIEPERGEVEPAHRLPTASASGTRRRPRRRSARRSRRRRARARSGARVPAIRLAWISAPSGASATTCVSCAASSSSAIAATSGKRSGRLASSTSTSRRAELARGGGRDLRPAEVVELQVGRHADAREAGARSRDRRRDRATSPRRRRSRSRALELRGRRERAVEPAHRAHRRRAAEPDRDRHASSELVDERREPERRPGRAGRRRRACRGCAPISIRLVAPGEVDLRARRSRRTARARAASCDRRPHLARSHRHAPPRRRRRRARRAAARAASRSRRPADPSRHRRRARRRRRCVCATSAGASPRARRARRRRRAIASTTSRRRRRPRGVSLARADERDRGAAVARAHVAAVAIAQLDVARAHRARAHEQSRADPSAGARRELGGPTAHRRRTARVAAAAGRARACHAPPTAAHSGAIATSVIATTILSAPPPCASALDGRELAAVTTCAVESTRLSPGSWRSAPRRASRPTTTRAAGRPRARPASARCGRSPSRSMWTRTAATFDRH